MASAADDDAAKICKLLLAALLLLVSTGTAAASNHGTGGCIRRVDEVSMLGSCKCYERCSDPEKGGLMNAESQTCFVKCVLRHGCVCDGGEVVVVDPAAAAGPPSGPRVVLSAPLVKTLRVNVTRPPKVSKSRAERERWEEMLVVEFSVDPSYGEFGAYDRDMSIHYNCPEGREQKQIDEREYTFTWVRMSPPFRQPPSYTLVWPRKVIRIPIRKKLEYLGADGDETIAVTFYPSLLYDASVAREDAINHYKRSGLTIEAVSIQYLPRA